MKCKAAHCVHGTNAFFARVADLGTAGGCTNQWAVRAGQALDAWPARLRRDCTCVRRSPRERPVCSLHKLAGVAGFGGVPSHPLVDFSSLFELSCRRRLRRAPETLPSADQSLPSCVPADQRKFSLSRLSAYMLSCMARTQCIAWSCTRQPAYAVRSPTTRRQRPSTACTIHPQRQRQVGHSLGALGPPH